MVNIIFRTILTVFFVIYTHALTAGVQEEIFLNANRLYQAGEFNNALALYESITQKGVAVWYNMALAAYHLNRKPEALAHLYRALQQADWATYRQIKNTIVLINPVDSWIVQCIWYLEYCASFLPYIYWQLLVICLAWITVLLLWGNYKRYKIHVVSCVSWVSCVLLLSVKYQSLHQQYAIIKDHGANLYAGPNPDFFVKQQIRAVENVIVLQEKNSWYKVRYGSTQGWLQADDVIKC